MDADGFDALFRSLTAAGSRRRALGALGSVLGLARGASSRDDAAAKKKCPPCKKRKQGTCKGKKPDGTACRGGTCQGGRCVTDPCTSCTGDQVCTGGQCVVPACGKGGPCLVFLSSMLYQGNLGGLSGADAKCQSMATAAGLPGAYRAWLSDDTSSPASRFVPSTGPYRLVNGTTIAANWTDLTDGTLLAPITVTETGGGKGDTPIVWTHTDADGTGDGFGTEHCSNWNTNAFEGFGGGGNSGFSTSVWTDGSVYRCNERSHLYCFQQR